MGDDTGQAARDRAETSFDRLYAELEPIGRDPATGGYRRFVYADAELTLREWFTSQAAARSLDVHEDRGGNLWAWWGDPSDGGAVGTGSHLDSVPQGGAFDGPLGVVSAFAAIDVLRERGVEPARPLGVVAFADEEGARFGVACSGSRLLTGALSPERALGLTDQDGVTFAEALQRTGRAPESIGRDDEVLGSIGTFVELHVEQGRGLIELDAPVGLYHMIRPHGRYRFDLHGRADHAGATRIEDRDDPMLTHAELVLAARAAAVEHGAVATVGRVLVEPNGINAIPSLVRAWLDTRADEESTVKAIVSEVSDAIGVEPFEEMWTTRVDLDTGLQDRLEGILGIVPRIPSGAGHDAGIIATAGVPTAMIVVRNPTGVSHSPHEHAERDDCIEGVVALADALEDLLS